MTGFEVAGIVLAILPLLTEGLKFYTSSAQTFRDFWRTKACLKRLMIGVDLERIILQDTLGKLLEGVVDEAEMSNLVISGHGWDDQELHKKLDQRIGKGHLGNSFIEALQELQQDIENVLRMLGLYDSSSLKPIAHIGQVAITRGRWKDVKTVLKRKDIEKHLEKISAMNKTLSTVVGCLPRWELKRSVQIPADIARRCKLLREQAIHLFRFLCRKLSSPECQCSLRHYVSLQLDSLCYNKQATSLSAANMPSLDKNYKLSIMACFERGFGASTYDWLEMQVQPVELVLSSSGCEESLHENCATVQLVPEAGENQQFGNNCPEPQEKSLVKGKGFLPSITFINSPTEKGCKSSFILIALLARPSKSSLANHRMGKKESRVAFDLPMATGNHETQGVAKGSKTLTSSAVVTFCQLSEMIRRTGLPPKTLEMHNEEAQLSYQIEPWKRTRQSQALTLRALLEPDALSIRDRLNLAIQLAFSVLQLYDTEWLPRKWSSDDILFLTQCRRCRMKDGRFDDAEEPILGKPLIQKIPESLTLIQSKEPPNTLFVDESVYSLGLVLAELALEQPLKTRESISEHLIRISSLVGPQYATAVESCLRGFGIGTLGDKKVMNEFYETVLVPLQDKLASLDEELLIRRDRY